MPKFTSEIEADSGLSLPSGASFNTPAFGFPGGGATLSTSFIGTSVGHPNGGVTVSQGLGYSQFDATGGYMMFREVLPFPCILDRVSVSFTGAPGHSAAPATLPNISVTCFNLNGASQGSLGSAVYVWSSIGVYQSLNVLHLPNSGGGLALDATLYNFYLGISVRNENGLNSIPGLIIHGIQYRCFLEQPLLGR